MTRLARALCSLHGAVLAWLAYCAMQSARNGATWAVLLFAAASLMTVIAVIRETELTDERRTAAVRAERVARLRAHAEEDVAALARIELAAACCEPWWTSAGTDHDPACPNSQRSSAA
ncbi:hypothetical protein ACFWY6_12760 [Streptomyces sp. NPDC059037]|uniref:hypothetical protein n=1 Tax=Streptomyces sp. NPDC059037 TaxID=3346710 RepID=UPI0036CEB271